MARHGRRGLIWQTRGATRSNTNGLMLGTRQRKLWRVFHLMKAEKRAMAYDDGPTTKLIMQLIKENPGASDDVILKLFNAAVEADPDLRRRMALAVFNEPWDKLHPAN
jgi:hypothetical protein